MEVFGLLWQIFAFIMMTIFGKVAYVADEILFTLEDYEAFEKVVKVCEKDSLKRKFIPETEPAFWPGYQFLSFCIGNFYSWQALATIIFYHYLRRLAARFPPPPSNLPTPAIDIGAVDVNPPNMQELVLEEEEKEKDSALREAASKIEDLDKEKAILRKKVDRLEKDVDFISKDRYALVRENCILQNKLDDFNSWPEFRVEYDRLATEFEVMKRQRAREHYLQEQYLRVAKEARLQLAEAKLAEVVSKITHGEELKQAQKERDEAKEKNQALLVKTAAAAATITTTTTAITASVAFTPAATESTLGNKVLQEEHTRLTLNLRSQTSLLSKKSSELERMKTLIKTRSDHFLSELRKAEATICNLKEEKEQADMRIAKLKMDVKEANAKTDELEDRFMAVALGDESEGEENEGKEEGEGKADTSRLLKQLVAMSKQKRISEEGPDEDGSKKNNEDDEEEALYEGNEEDKERDLMIHNENEDLFKDMMGSPWWGTWM